MAFSLVETGRRADVSFSFIWLSQKAQSPQKKQVTFPKLTHQTEEFKTKYSPSGIHFGSYSITPMSTHTQSTPIYQALVLPDGKLATFISLSIHPCLKVVSRKGIVSELSASANANASMNIRLDIHLYFFSTQSHHWWLDLGPGSSGRRHYSQHQCKYPTEFYHVIQCWTRKYTPRVPPHRWPLESISKACCRTARVRSSTSNKGPIPNTYLSMPPCSACHTWIRSSHCSLESLCWSITLHKERGISKIRLYVLQYPLMLIFAIALLKN